MRCSLLVTVCLLGAFCFLLAAGHPTSSSAAAADSSSPSASPDSRSSSEGLPPDTFRKLAQALYDRGDKAANRLQRKFFYNDNVTCNDGSVAGYYMRRNYKSQRWVVFLQGGWICHDEESCSSRASREHYRMSSDRWPSEKTVGGILSADPDENPHFADANHVFVPYCSSDAWSGTQKGDGNNRPAFLGHYIVREVLRELRDYEQLFFHNELYLAGGSAGGAGVLVNVDMVADMVAPANMKVRGIVDSGWFLDNEPFSSDCAYLNGGECSVIGDFQKGVKMWNARVPRRCAAAYPGEEWKCFLGYKIYPLIQSPLFIIQWQFDTFQMYADNVALPASRDQWNYIHQSGRRLRETFNNVSAVFSPSCIAHEVITMSYWTDVEVSGVSLPDALQCWAASLPAESNHVPSGDYEAADSEDGFTIRKMNALAPTAGLHRTSASVLSESPYKLARNLVRSIPDGAGRDQYRNSINRHLSDGGRHASRRHHRRRHRNNRTNSVGELDDGVGFSRKRNRDLVRQLKRSTKKQKGKGKSKKGGKKRKPKSEEEMQRRRERRRRRKQEKKRKRRERKQRQRRLKRLEHRRLKKERLLQQQQQDDRPESGAHHVNVRSADSTPPSPSSSSGQCHFKLIDRCSWPHCNRSCPKLKNPDTGQEIDFLTLLQSFGLNLNELADALGVDVASLNNKNRDVLFRLLTSQQQHPKGHL